MEAITVRPSLAKFLRVDTTKKAAALESVPRPKKKHTNPFLRSLVLR
jgi:hypothetical protein